MGEIQMELINKIMVVLWNILDTKKDCSINVATIDEKLTVNILRGRRRKTFSHHDGNIVLMELKQYLAS